jgi:hypothetical protein
MVRNCPSPKKSRFQKLILVNWAIPLVGHARFVATLLVHIVKIVSSGAMNAFMIKCPNDGGPISGLAPVNAPARRDNRMDPILSQRKSSVLIQ